MTAATGNGWHDYERVAPEDVESMASLLRRASESGSVVQVVGGGTRQGYGSPVPPQIVLEMGGLSGIEEWDPDDLTVTVGPRSRIWRPSCRRGLRPRCSPRCRVGPPSEGWSRPECPHCGEPVSSGHESACSRCGWSLATAVSSVVAAGS
jgi:hypothetical protein